MPRYTNPAGGGGSLSSYYHLPPHYGSYAYISLAEIMANFIATYIGTGKLLEGTLKGDVHYHAHRALQELSYDTIKSDKSLEIEVCPSLRVPLPHDYVNYVKIAWVDSNGIERILYPAAKTSYPISLYQNDMDECTDNDMATANTYTQTTELTAAPNNLTLNQDFKKILYVGTTGGGNMASQIHPDSWTRYRGSGSNSVAVNSSLTANASVDNDSYFDNAGKRYGLDPQYAQSNGTFFID